LCPKGGEVRSPRQANLEIYFLGGKTPATAPTAGTTESFTIDIADQSEKLPVLSYAASEQVYADGNTTYSATLLTQCNLVSNYPRSSEFAIRKRWEGEFAVCKRPA